MDDAQTRLARTFKPHWVFAMAVGSAVGWGAFILPYDWLVRGGLGGVLLGFLVGGGLIMIVAVNYGIAVRAAPVTGGGLAFALKAMGRGHGFVAGWGLMLGYAGIVALNASAVTLIFRVTVPDLVTWGRLYTVAGWDVYIPEVVISWLFLVLFCALNVRGSAMSGRVQFAAVALMLVAVFALLIAAVGEYLSNPRPVASWFPTDVSAVAATALIVAIAPWAYVGFDTVPQLAGEFNFTPTRALRLLVLGVASATFIYVAVSVVTAITVGADLGQYSTSAWPPAAAVRDVIGRWGLVLMVVAVSMGVLTGLNGFLAASGRIVFAMGRTKMLPTWAGRVHPRYGTPHTGMIAVSLVCLITPWFGRAALSWIVDMTSVGITIAYFYTCCFVVRISGNLPDRRRGPIRALGVAGCLASVGFMALLLVPSSPGALATQSQVALAAWLAVGAATYVGRRADMRSMSVDEMTDCLS